MLVHGSNSKAGSQGRQTKRGGSWSEGLVSSQHVPDCVGEAAGDADLGDPGPALPAEPLLLARLAHAYAGCLSACMVDSTSAQRREGGAML
jgi:hypothetical protein